MSGSNERESWYRTEEPPRLVVYYDPPRPSRAAAFLKGLKIRAGRVWRLGREKRGETSMSKPFEEWTPAEMKAECAKNASPEKCEGCLLREKGGYKRCLPAVIFQTSHHPCDWELDIGCPMTEQEMTICRTLGAKWLTHQVGARDVWLTKNKPERKVDEKGRIYYESGEDIGEIAIVNTSLFPSIKEQDDFSVIVG